MYSLIFVLFGGLIFSVESRKLDPVKMHFFKRSNFTKEIFCPKRKQKMSFSSVESSGFLNILSEFTPSAEYRIIEQAVFHENYENKVKMFKIMLNSVLKPPKEYDENSVEFATYFLKFCRDYLKPGSSIFKKYSTKTFSLLVNNFMFICIINRENKEFIQNVISSASKIAIFEEKNSILFKKLTVICMLLQKSVTQSDIECVLHLPNEHFQYVFQHLINSKMEMTTLLLCTTVPNYYVKIEKMPESESCVPDPYAMMEFPENAFVSDEYVSFVMTFCRKVFIDIQKQGLNLTNATLLSNLLSAGDMFRGCFTILLIHLCSMPCHIPSFIGFIQKLKGKIGAAILRQLIMFNTTESLKVLLKIAGPYIAQAGAALQGFLEADISMAIASFSMWNDCAFETVSVKITHSSQLTKIFAKYLVFLKANQTEAWDTCQSIEELYGSFFERMNEIIEVMKDPVNCINPLMICNLSALLEQIFKLLYESMSSKCLFVIGEKIVQFTYYTVNFIFSVMIENTLQAPQYRLNKLMREVTSFIENNSKTFSTFLTIRSYESHILSFAYITSLISDVLPRKWEETFCSCILSESTCGYYCAQKLLGKVTEGKIKSCFNIILNLCIDSTQENKNSTIKSISKIILILAKTLKPREFPLITRTTTAQAVLISIKNFIIDNKGIIERPILSFINATMLLYKELFMYTPSLQMFIPIEKLYKYLPLLTKEAADAYLGIVTQFITSYKATDPPSFLKFSKIAQSKASKKSKFFHFLLQSYPNAKFPAVVTNLAQKYDQESEIEDDDGDNSVNLLPWLSFPDYFDIFQNGVYLTKIMPSTE